MSQPAQPTIYAVTAQPTHVTVGLDVLRSCRTRNAIVVYTSLLALADGDFAPAAVTPLLQVSGLSRTSLYAALAELTDTGLIERTRRENVRGFSLRTQGKIVPFAGTRLTYKNRVVPTKNPARRDEKIPPAGTNTKVVGPRESRSLISRTGARRAGARTDRIITPTEASRENPITNIPTRAKPDNRIHSPYGGSDALRAIAGLRPAQLPSLARATHALQAQVYGALALAEDTMPRITNVQRAPDGATPKTPRNPLSRFSAVTYAKHLGMVARIAVRPEHYTGKDGKLWKQLFDTYGDEELRILIQQTVRNKDKLNFGAWKNAKLTVAAVMFYGKHYYESREDRAIKNDVAQIETLPQWLVKDGAPNEDALGNYAKMLGVPSDDLRRRIETELLATD